MISLYTVAFCLTLQAAVEVQSQIDQDRKVRAFGQYMSEKVCYLPTEPVPMFAPNVLHTVGDKLIIEGKVLGHTVYSWVDKDSPVARKLSRGQNI